MKSPLLCLLLLIFLSKLSIAQSDTLKTVWQVETTDGNIYTGEKVQETNEFVELATKALGNIKIPKNTIMLMRTISEKEAAKTKARSSNDAQATRYFFSPNAYNLKKGQGYYQNSWVFYNQASYGITDNFSIGGGLVPLFLFGAGAPTPVFITPKVSIPISADKITVAAGALVGGIVGGDFTQNNGFAGIAYGVSSFGSRERNISIGVGYGFAGIDFANRPIILVGGITKIGKRAYLMSENYIVPVNGGTIAFSGGGRWVGNSISIDYGLYALLTGFGGGGALPWLSLTVPFGKDK
ncbi:MAG: hypothetical protein AAGI23_05530 [Bacteroidota bacterium]